MTDLPRLIAGLTVTTTRDVVAVWDEDVTCSTWMAAGARGTQVGWGGGYTCVVFDEDPNGVPDRVYRVNGQYLVELPDLSDVEAIENWLESGA